jgi:xylulokinase
MNPLMTYLLGLDISTTGAKALIVDPGGRVVAAHNTPQPISTPRPLWSEQNPADWWAGTVASIRRALADAGLTGDAITAIGVTGQMHGLVLLDAADAVLRPAMLWNDQRTGPQCAWITEQVGFERLIQLTGNRALTGFTAPKLVWVRQHEPDLWDRATGFVLPKDYLRLKLTGDRALDLSDAAGTGLLDVAARRWSGEVADALGIPARWLPRLAEGTEVTGVVSAAAAAETGLRAGTPVVGGGGDQAAGAVGVGAVSPGVISLVIGTSGVVFAPLDRYAYDPDGRVHAFCHSIPHTWHFMGVMLSAAGSLQWYRDTLAPDVPFAHLIDEAAAIAPGSDGLFFLPYLTGERTPHPDPLARGAFIGLTTRHTRAHMTRAVLEGVAFGLRDGFALMQAAGLSLQGAQVRVSGGGAQSALWRTITAGVLDVPLETAPATDGAAYGAALLAGVGAGVYPSAAAACATAIDGAAGEAARTVTQPEARDVYAERYGVYTRLYPALKEVFTHI